MDLAGGGVFPRIRLKIPKSRQSREKTGKTTTRVFLPTSDHLDCEGLLARAATGFPTYAMGYCCCWLSTTPIWDERNEQTLGGCGCLQTSMYTRSKLSRKIANAK